ncbi:DUF3048 domain-containing protein [Actinomarinicola tropica]|uniref:DUF3048 domain-containing protein n=1 Tax=Actinomarinicola tropica TaxID=2789776 RepID=A0A5Q2RKN4_9ACTN|nr:DUF3048 domain-containing protein [Actinomarinicola tropica]QGG95141.1 DUF3048 domain-containing protein [Actinomarinicola tropica]
MPTRPLRRATTLVALVLSLALLAVACGGDDDESASTTTAPSTTTTEATTTTTEPPPVMQLTGLPVPDGDELAPLRTAMIVKIDNNNSNARPQRGITTADVVIEEAVEGNESRFFAIFHTNLTDPVGPVRSARTSDIDLMPMFGRPTFSSSGGNAGTMGSIRDNDVAVVAGHDSPFGSFFFRLNNDGDIRRRGPHNLFVNLSELYAAAADQGSSPPPFATWRGADDALPETALPTFGVDITFGQNPIQWVWDEPAGGFLRWQRGTPHVDPDGTQVNADNVLLLMTPYAVSPFDATSPEARSVGSGEGWVLTAGQAIHGTWTRETREATYTFTDDEGNVVPLTPGQTWVELLKPQNPPSFLEADPRG